MQTRPRASHVCLAMFFCVRHSWNISSPSNKHAGSSLPALLSPPRKNPCATSNSSCRFPSPNKWQHNSAWIGSSSYAPFGGHAGSVLGSKFGQNANFGVLPGLGGNGGVRGPGLDHAGEGSGWRRGGGMSHSAGGSFPELAALEAQFREVMAMRGGGQWQGQQQQLLHPDAGPGGWV
jgi:hypothetical protein